jgi:hypothetical protein
MSIITASFIQTPKQFVQPDLFSLIVKQNNKHTDITMNMFNAIVNTRSLPHTYTILGNQLPSIYKATCFNDNNLPFSEEVLHTEIGHLFEHILLEYLCLYKIKNGSRAAVFNGETSWNWKSEPYGTFHISIDAGVRDDRVFEQALNSSISLINTILQKSN